MARLRTLDYQYTTGGSADDVWGWGLGHADQASVWNGQKWMSDTVGNPHGVNPLSMEIDKRIAFRTSGQVGPWSVSNWICPIQIVHETAGAISMPSENDVLSSAIARSNPSRPVVDLPVLLFEIKDIPRMIKSFGESILRGGFVRDPRSTAGSLLSWEFGWKPLISDLGKILDFTEHVEKRVNVLDTLLGGQLHSAPKGWNDEDTPAYQWRGPVYPVPLYSCPLHIWYLTGTTRRRWASLVWRPNSEMQGWNSDDVRLKARQAVFGQGQFSFATIWQMLPWSWLIDWFSNVGDLIEGSRNLIPAASSDYCVMTNTQSRIVTYDVYSNNGGASVTLLDPLYEWKERSTPIGTYPEAHLPFIDARRLSILSSLAVQRLPRR